MEKIKAIRFDRSINFPRPGESVYQSEPIMTDLGPTAFFYPAGQVDRLVEAAEEMIKSCKDIWVEQFKDGGVDNFWSAENNLYAALKALEGEKHGTDQV